MPSLADHPGHSLVKILAIGDSGCAKTGSLVSLALAGYKLKIADFDNGLDVVAHLLRDHPEALARVEYETFTNEYEWKSGATQVGVKPGDVPKGRPVKADAIDRALARIKEWSASGPDTFLVIDSTTSLGVRFMERIQALTGNAGKQPTQPEWGAAMSDFESFLNQMSSSSVTCNTIMFAHVTYVEVEGSAGASPYPTALGSKLPPKLPRYFNTMIGYRVEGTGDNAKREIVTTPHRGLGFKTPNPTKIKSRYPLNPNEINRGLVDLIRDLGIKTPGGK